MRVDVILPNDYTCPHCGAVADTCLSKGENRFIPHNGDVSICAKCAEPSCFKWDGDTVSLVVPTPEQMQEIKDQPGLWEEVESYRRFIKRGGHGFKTR